MTSTTRLAVTGALGIGDRRSTGCDGRSAPLYAGWPAASVGRVSRVSPPLAHIDSPMPHRAASGRLADGPDDADAGMRSPVCVGEKEEGIMLVCCLFRNAFKVYVILPPYG